MTNVCDTCDKRFSTVGNLMRHLRSVHSSKAYQCSTCIKISNRKDILRAHERRMHEKEVDRSTYRYGCDMCGQRCKSSQTLYYHRKVQHSGKVFECHLCIKMFTTKKALRVHLANSHDKLTYEKKLLKGKRLLKLMVDNNVPLDIVPKEDTALINMYQEYTQQKVDKFADCNIYN